MYLNINLVTDSSKKDINYAKLPNNLKYTIIKWKISFKVQMMHFKSRLKSNFKYNETITRQSSGLRFTCAAVAPNLCI